MGMFRNLMMRRRRNVIPGFVGGWKSYGRSNSEDASTRDILPDYSGNGRDIKLYNFAFSGMSGWGGYERNWDEWLDVYIGNNGHNYQENNVLHILEVSEWANTISDVVSGETVKLKLRVSGLSENITNNEVQNIQLYFNASTAGSTLYIREDGDYDVNLTAPEGAIKFHILAKSTETLTGWTPLTTPITIEQLPTYPGGLVSDGVDDYGECVKQFVLTDFTVVALRNYADFTQVNNATLVAKTTGNNANGAFLFEDGPNMDCFSFGSRISNSDSPALFSYLTKTSFNGKDGTSGTIADTDNALLHLFSRGSLGTILKKQAVLYDLRIYDHSLTTEELQTVKDEMMSDYEKNAKPLEGITYVADWDAKGRSNDEDADVRNKWIDKATGKVINLNNFAYAGMSGWNGYAENFNDHSSPSVALISDHKLIHTVVSGNAWIWTRSSSIYSTTRSMQVKITGLSNSGISIYYYYIPSENPNTRDFIDITSDGTYTLPNSALYTGDGTQNIGFWQSALSNPNIGTTITIEQLPLYPGALVGDGIDDYGVTQEAINEEVGTILLHYRRLIEVPTKWGYYYDGLNSTRIFAAYANTSPYFCTNMVEKYNDGNLLIGTTSDTADALLYIMANNSSVERGQVAIFRLIIIREQLDDAQVEFLRWKVEKEYREWCRANGYEYAINQLTE